MLRASTSARARLKSEVDARQVESELADFGENLEHMAHLALSSLLSVTPTPPLPVAVEKLTI